LPVISIIIGPYYGENKSLMTLELTANVVDINFGSGEAALARCDAFQGYSFLVAEIRKNLRNGMKRDAAIIAAIETRIPRP